MGDMVTTPRRVCPAQTIGGSQPSSEENIYRPKARLRSCHGVNPGVISPLKEPKFQGNRMIGLAETGWELGCQTGCFSS